MVAVKRFLEQNLSASVLRDFKAEVSIMSRLRHPNVVGAAEPLPFHEDNKCHLLGMAPSLSLYSCLTHFV